MSKTESIAVELRQLVIKMLTAAGSGHAAGAIDLADIYAVLYFSDLINLDPHHPDDPERDRIIISNGHTCPVLYAALAKRGFFPLEELDTLRQYGSRLQGHPHKDFKSTNNLPGIENTSGPLGQGTSFAVGLALGVKLQWQQGKIARLPKVICICGDGELNEGQCWESFMAAAKYQLNNLTYIIDRNGIQIDGYTEDVMPLEPLKDKVTSFGLMALEVDGHNHESIKNALAYDAAFHAKPTAIIAHTIPGKGVEFMENRPGWHGKTPSIGEAVEALRELNTLQDNIVYD